MRWFGANVGPGCFSALRALWTELQILYVPEQTMEFRASTNFGVLRCPIGFFRIHLSVLHNFLANFRVCVAPDEQ
jgi:hypothetical protein